MTNEEKFVKEIIEYIFTYSKMEQFEDEPLTCDGNCWMKKQNGEWLCEHCQRKPKTEPNCSEKPNNCEHITEDGVTCAKYPACDDCLDNPLNKLKGSERLVKGSEQTDLVEDSPSLVKDLVKAFGEDGTWLERQGVYTLTLAEAKQRAVDIIESVLAKDEPTISKMEQVDEPITQTKTQNSNLTFEKADERCKGCNHYKLTCDLFSEICRYEPKDEPQIDYTPDCPFCKRYGTEDCLGSDCRHYKTYKTESQTERSK